MYCANKAVRAYNWTTGKTKADLANKLLTIAPIAESVGMIIISPILSTFTPLTLLGSHMAQKENSRLEELELDALDLHAKNSEAEKYKNYARFFGPILLATGNLLSFSSPFNKASEGFCVFGAGIVIRGSSYYFMRADPLLPRKNVVRRAVDRLEEILEKHKTLPAPVPAQ